MHGVARPREVLYRPSEHLVHAALPWALYVPSGHSPEQALLASARLSPKRPALHGMQALRRSLLCFPVGHSLQSTAPTSGANCPASQGRHCALDAPGANLPAGQSEHESEIANMWLKRPGPQGVHTLPVTTLPAGHAMQA